MRLVWDLRLLGVDIGLVMGPAGVIRVLIWMTILGVRICDD